MEYTTGKMTAVCHLLKFRSNWWKLARIISTTLLERHFTPRENKPQPFEHSGGGLFPTISIDIVIDKSLRDKLVERYGQSTLNDYDTEHYRAQITIPYHEFGYRYLTSFGTGLRILGPAPFKQDYQNYLQKLIDLNQD